MQYRRYIPEDEENGFEDPESIRTDTRPSRGTSFKKFVDTKETEIKDKLKRKGSDSSSKQQTSQIADGQLSS